MGTGIRDPNTCKQGTGDLNVTGTETRTQHMQAGDTGPQCCGDSSLLERQCRGHPRKGFLGHRPTAQLRIPQAPCHSFTVPSGASKAPLGKAKVGAGGHLSFPKSHQLLLQATSPLNYLR